MQKTTDSRSLRQRLSSALGDNGVLVLGYAGAAILVTVDRLLKWYATHSLPAEGVFWIPKLLGIERFTNSGIAFSLPVHRKIILGATAVALLAICLLKL